MNQKRVMGYIRVLLFMLPLILTRETNAQCDPTVPTFYVDLSGTPDSIWTSADTARKDFCCGTTSDRCVRFILTLDSNAVGINFHIVSGAIPPGALYYQIGCGASYAVGDDICLNGVGPHEITFCKPGNNTNVYGITSIAEPKVSDPIIVSDACRDTLFVTSLVEDSIVWRSVPNLPFYDTYLSQSSGEDTVIVTPSGNYPSYVDYEVCGTILGSCGASNFCDTVRVTFVSSFVVTILPEDPSICFGGSPAELYAVGSGGIPPYTFLWSTGQYDDTILVNQGTYSVTATDSLNCAAAVDSVVVDSFSYTITANAGNDTLMCKNESAIFIDAEVTGVSTGTWRGGAGTFSPSPDSIDMFYTPDSSERTSGQVTLFLYTTNNKNCPGDTDDVLIRLEENPVPLIQGPDTACQFETAFFYNPNLGSSIQQWTVSTGSISNSASANPVEVIWNDTGFHTLQLQMIDTPGGCDSVISYSVYVASSPVEAISGADTACQVVNEVYSVPFHSGHTYAWTAQGGTISGSVNSNSVTINWTDTGTVMASVRIANALGCDTLISFPVYVALKPKPVISGNDSTCLNKSYTYSVAAQNGHSYQWSVSGGTLYGDPTSTSIDVLWTSTGAGSVSLVQSSPEGCDTLVSLPVSVLYTPAPLIALPNDTACQNKIYAYSISASAAETIQWTVTGGQIIGDPTASSINVRWSGPGTGTITVTQTSPFGCDSTITANVTIVSTPAPLIQVPNDSTCAFKIAHYSVTPVAGETYLWEAAGGQIIGNPSASEVDILWGTPGSGTVTLTQTSVYGCDSTVSANITIVYTPLPLITLPNDTACENKIYTYSISTSPGETQLWSVSGGQILGDPAAGVINILWAGPGTGTITVTQVSAFGCDSTVSARVNIVQTPKPVIQLPNDSTCAFKIAHYAVDPVAGEKYLWQVSGGQVIGSSTSPEVDVLWGTRGTGNISLTQTSVYGCDSTVSQNISIVYTPVPIITLPNDTVCENKIYTYSVNVGSGETVFWKASGGQIIGNTNGNQVNVLWAGPGIGTLEVTLRSSFGCDSTISEKLNIIKTPVPLISPGNDTICAYRAASYAVAWGPGQTYHWQVQGGSIVGSSNSYSVNVLWGGSGLGTLSVTQTNRYGCDSTVQKTVLIKPNPEPVIAGPSKVCLDNQETYSTYNVPGFYYRWEVLGGTMIGRDDLSIIAVLWDVPGSGEIRLTLTNELGCDSSIVLNVQVNSNPVATIDGNSLACANSTGNPYYLQDYGIRSNSLNQIFEWSVIGGQIMRGMQDDTVTINWDGPGSHPVILKLTNYHTGCFAYDTFHVSVGTMQSPLISAEDYTGCVPFSLSLSEQNGVDSVDYLWTVIGLAGLQSSEASPTFMFYNTGLYHVRLIVKNKYGCADTAFYKVDATRFVIADFLIVSADSLFPGSEVLFVNQSTGASGNEWSFHDGVLNYTVHTSKVYEEHGRYPVTLVAWNELGCTDTVTKEVVVKAIPEIFIPNAFTPNRDFHNRYFTISTLYVIDMDFIIFDRWGEIVYRCTDLDIKWDGTFKGKPVPDGVFGYYMVGLDVNGDYVIRKGTITVLH